MNQSFLPETVVVPSHVVTQHHAGGMIVANMQDLTYQELDPVGTSMWDALVRWESTDQAVHALLREYSVDQPTLKRDLAVFISHLRDRGLLVDESQPQEHVAPELTIESIRDRYLDLVARSTCGVTALPEGPPASAGDGLLSRLNGNFPSTRSPSLMSMIGLLRMTNVRRLCERALADGIPGDFVECGVWRGGVGIMMRAVLEAYADPARRVWLADSFAGLPAADLERFPVDALFSRLEGMLAVSSSDVRRNLQVYGLLDDRVRFLEGWFSDTLAESPIERIAVLRLDGDYYASIMDCLVALYDRVAPGGFVIIDDYAYDPPRQAVQDFAASRGFTPDLVQVDWNAVWWRKA